MQDVVQGGERQSRRRREFDADGMSLRGGNGGLGLKIAPLAIVRDRGGAVGAAICTVGDPYCAVGDPYCAVAA